jgi:hypothetical protein
MQEHCIKEGSKGALEVRSFLERHSLLDQDLQEAAKTKETQVMILIRCSKDWKNDYQMMGHCIRKQEEAAIRLGKIPPDAPSRK